MQHVYQDLFYSSNNVVDIDCVSSVSKLVNVDSYYSDAVIFIFRDINDGELVTHYTYNYNSDISIVCHLNQKYEKTVYASYDIRDFKLITLISSSETKFETKINSYLNSVFSYKNKKLLEKYLRNDHSSLKIFDIKSDEIFFNSNSYGFMEAVAFTDNYVALSENNTLKVVKI